MDSLPSKVLSKIYVHVHGSHNVDIEVDDGGALLTTACKLLRVSRSMRRGILEACRQQHLQLVHTIRSPSGLSRFWARTGPPARTIRFVLLAKLEGIDLTHEEERGSSHGPNAKPLFKAWREAFRAAPHHIDLAYFDLVRDFRLEPRGVARLIHNLSVILGHRTRGVARCRIIGCRTVQGKLYVERSTFNVIHSDVEVRKKSFDPYTEYLAGPPADFPAAKSEVPDEPDASVRLPVSPGPEAAVIRYIPAAGKKRTADEMS